jgi:hypothetical protein
VLVSAKTSLLLAGSGITFESARSHELKGLSKRTNCSDSSILEERRRYQPSNFTPNPI